MNTEIKIETLTRACPVCEKIHGILDRADASKSHGLCRRHFVALLKDGGIADAVIQAEILKLVPESFCPDLGEVA